MSPCVAAIMGTLLLGVEKKRKRSETDFYPLILMFTINRTIVSEAYGCHRARLAPHHVQAQGPADGHITQSTTPFPSPHQKSGNTHQMIVRQRLRSSPNSKLKFTYYCTIPPNPKPRSNPKKQNAPLLQYGFLCAELDSTDKMTTLRSTETGVLPARSPPATVRQVTKSYAQLKTSPQKKVRW